MIARRSAFAGLAAAAVAAWPAAARRFATLITAAPPGSGGDDIARSFARHLETALNGPEILVRNVPGDGGRAALHALAEAPPSGATLGWVATPVLPARAVDRGDPHLPGRLALLGSVEREPIVFVASAADPLGSVRDIVQRAGQDAGALPLGTPPPGSAPHLAALRLQALTQTRLNIVAFPSAAAARQALLGGNVTAAVMGLADTIVALREEKLIGLGIAARRRSGILPDMPVLSEAGVPLSAWIRCGLAVPVATPPAIQEPLISAIRSLAASPDFAGQAETMGLLAAWSEGAVWTAQVEKERAELAILWAADPWLNASGQ